MAQQKQANLHHKDIEILKILKENPEGLRVTTILKLLNLKRKTAYNHLRNLEKKGYIINLYPIWKLTKNGTVQTSSEIWHTSLYSSKEQGHKIVFILPLIHKPEWWSKRKDRLIRLKDWHFKKEVTAKNNIYYQIEKEGLLINLYKNSIYFICQRVYYGNTPLDIFLQAQEEVLESIRFLEERFKFKFIAEGNAHLTVQDGHYLTYQDALSDYCEKIDDRFKLKTKEGYELWVDFSDPKGTEANNPEVKRRYLMDIKDRQDNPETPVASKIWELSKENTLQLNKTLEILKSNQDLISGLPIVLNDLKQQISSHLALIQEYRKENIIWRKEKEKEYKQDKNQKKLLDFF